MKRYLLFGFNEYYPSGGWNDFKGFFASINEAYEYGFQFDAINIVDSETWKIVVSCKK